MASILDLVDDFNKQCQEAARQTARQRRRATRCRTWPMVSNLGISIHPSQVEEMRERNKKMGIAVDYKPNGDAVVSGPVAYKKLLRSMGYHNKDSYGGIY